MSRVLFVAAVVAGMAGPALAQPRPTPAATEPVIVDGVGTVNMLIYKARVVSTDPATRRVVLEDPSGRRWSVLAPLVVGDLAALQNSEQVTIRVIPAVVTALGKAHQGRPGELMNEVAVEAGPFGFPQGFGVRQVTLTSIMVWIDKAAGTITFEGLDGQVRVVKALDGKVLADLQQVQPGDLAQITYVEAMSFSTY